MKIRTQFIITMILFGMILVIFAVSATVTSQRIRKTSQQENLASNIAQGASDLSYLANDYLIYRESQQLKRWQSRFASFSNQVASLNVEKPEQQVLVRNIKANEQRLKQVFDSVASAVGNPSQDRSTALDLAFLQVSWSRMAVQSQGLVSDASRLSQLLHQQMNQLRDTRTILMYLMVGLFGLFLLASYMLTYRRILKSMATLQAGTAVIGSGNLDFKIEEKRNDEIGDLSRAFNRMTANLKDVTASKSELEKEIVERKKAEEDLRKQREWLRVTLSSIGDGVIATDTKGQVTFLNPVAVRLTGWESEEAMNQPINSVFHIVNEKAREPAVDLVSQALSEKRVVGLANDTALIDKDGREIPIDDSAAPILDAAGNMTGIVLVFHDVTQKRRAQEALREAHDRAAWLARFPEQNPNPVMRASSDGTVLYCNPASGKHLGWSCEVGQLLQNELLLLVDRAMVEGREVQQDIQLDGRFYIVWITPFPGEGYANIYARDITERKRAEEALHESEERYRNLFNTMDEGFCIIEMILDAKGRPADYRFLEVNAAFERQAGLYDAKDKLMRDLAPDHEAHWFEIYGKIALTGEPLHFMNEARALNRWYDVYAYRVGKPEERQVAIIFNDISGFKRAEAALRQRTLELQRLTETLDQQVRERTEQLEEANKALRQLSIRLLSAQEEERKRVAGELHDTIGSCLSGIKFKVESALQEIAKTPKAATESLNTIVPVIQEAVEECRRIQMDLRPSMLDDLGLLPTLSWFFRRFQTIYSMIHIEQEITIKESEMPGPLKIVIYRVIQEAMNNTAKHSKADLVRISLRKVHNKMELFVEDNGCGFSVQQRLFLDDSRRGLGLTSMRERTELSRGSFAIESAEGKGTIIRASWAI